MSLRNENNATREPKPDLPFVPISRGRRRPIYPLTWDIFLCPAPLCLPSHILLAFRNSLPAISRERTALTPVESVSIEVRRSNGRLDTFSSTTPFGQIGPGYTYIGSLRASTLSGSRGWPAGVGRLCNLHGDPHLFLGRTAREKLDGMERGSRGCGGEAVAASVHWGGWLTASLPTLLIVRARWPSVPRHCRVMISEKLVGMCVRVCVRTSMCSACSASLAGACNKPISASCA